MALFEMPPPELSTLPEKGVAHLRIRSWLLSSLLLSVGAYLMFITWSFLEGSLYLIHQHNIWWYTFNLPVTGLYLLLLIPLLRSMLTKTLETYRDIIPFHDRLRRLERRAYTLNRRGEWIALAIGAAVGMFVFPPPVFREHLSWSMFDILGDTLIFGLGSWHVYAALVRTKMLSAMHDHVQNLTVFRQTISYRPIVRWGVANTAAIVGAMAISSLFIPPEKRFQPITIVIYSSLALAAVLVFVFSKAPTSIMGQFRIFRAFFLFVAVAVVGMIGFNWLEGWALRDSLYATVITMTTIGYGDFSPATPQGQLFTIFLSLFAIGIGGYAITSVASFVIEGNFHRFIKGRRVDKKIVEMRNHYIVCGSGKLGRQLAIEFYKSQVPFVVIEKSSAVLEELLHEVDIPYVQGDATQDESLQLAGIERAAGLIAALSDDKDNVFITLSGRAFNPGLRIISRVQSGKNKAKLKKAGADVVISPHEVSGRRMANEMLQAEVSTLLDEMLRAEQQTGQTLRLEEVHVNQIKIPALAERLQQGRLTVSDIGQRSHLMVVAVKRDSLPGDDPYLYTPRGNSLLQQGDVLIVLGTPEQRAHLQHNILSADNFESWISRLWS